MVGYLVRENYLKKIRAGKGDTGIIKVITGMRRCGKSVLLKMYADELRRSGIPEEDIIQINFEKFEYQDLTTKDRLNALLSERINKDHLTYVLLDEIQNVKDWELSLSALNAMGGCDVYVTGSNSDMLSSQLATHIAGRHVEIRIYPLSFSEFVAMHGYTDRDKAFSEYLEYGGLPGVDPSRGPAYAEDYLQGVYNTIVVKDVLRHVNVGDPSKVESMIRFLFSNIGNITNRSSIAKAANLPGSTVGIYLKAIEDAFLALACDRYDMVGKKLLNTNGKYYVPDLGLRKAVLNVAAGADISRPLENLVYVELLRRGYKVRTGSYRDREIDFVAVRYDSIEYYQVCQTMMSEGTLRRETGSLLLPRDGYHKTVLTLDRFGLGSENGVQVRNVIDWLSEP